MAGLLEQKGIHHDPTEKGAPVGGDEGDASHGDSSQGEKKKLSEKIKEKLHIGKKE